MKLLRVLLMLFAIASSCVAVDVTAGTEPQVTVLNRHLAKLLGTWTSPEGDVTFNANSTLVYKGQKNYCAIAQGTIQISKRRTSIILPYRFVNGNLLITDGGTVTTYKRVPDPQ